MGRSILSIAAVCGVLALVGPGLSFQSEMSFKLFRRAPPADPEVMSPKDQSHSDDAMLRPVEPAKCLDPKAPEKSACVRKIEGALRPEN